MSSNPTYAPTPRALNRPAFGVMLLGMERALYGTTLVAAASLMWLAPRLPMIDLPQHAAQVALWRDLLTGQSPWSDLVHINLLTPYLIGYGLMLPFSFAFSMETVARIVVTLAFFGFAGAGMVLRREFGADRRLDWLFMLSFFGFTWKWGFLTFLVASPIGLLFLALAHRHTNLPTLARGLGLMASGIVLMFCHGLVFLIMLWLGGLLALAQVWQNWPKSTLPRLAPFMVLALAAVAFRFATQTMDGAMQADAMEFAVRVAERLPYLLGKLSDNGNAESLLLPIASVLGLMAGLLIGLKENAKIAFVPLAGFLLLALIVPTHFFQTDFILPRFALLLPSLIAILFRASNPQDAPTNRSTLALLTIIACCWITLVLQGARIAAFGPEARAFETVLAAAKPEKRALALIYDSASAAAERSSTYVHFASWYQADKHGFVDFNFAAFHPQIVRFKPGKAPNVGMNLGWDAANLQWSSVDMGLYDYYFVRADAAQVSTLLSAAPCKLETLASDGLWVLLGRGDCLAGPKR